MPEKDTGGTATIADVAKSVADLGEGLKHIPTLEQYNALNKTVADLTQELKEVKAAGPKQKAWTVPATCKASHQLRAFKTDEDAYVWGQKFFAMVHVNEPKFRSGATAASYKWCEDHGYIAKGTNQVEGLNTQGGFLVYDQNSTEIIDLKEQYGVFEPTVRVIQMNSDHFTMNRRTGGTTVNFAGELDSISVSNKT